MATFSNTTQGLNLSIADNGVYNIAGDTATGDQAIVVIRNGDSLYRTTVGSLKAAGISPSYTGSLSTAQLADTEGVFGKTAGLTLGLGSSNLQDFYKGATTTPGGTSYSLAADANNANAGVITDSTGRTLSAPAPAPQAGAINPTTGYVNPNAAMQIPSGQNPQGPVNTQGGTTTTTAPTVPQITSNLAPGSTGPEVSALQQWLMQQGYSIPSLANGAAKPGTYGPETQAAVAQWQKDQEAKNNLKIPDPSQYGFFGPLSRAAMTSSTGTGTGTGTGSGGATGTDTTGDGGLADTVKQLRQLYGLPAADPNKSLVQQAIDDYQSIYTALGIPSIKQSYTDAVNRFADLQKELNDKVSALRDDPWLSQGIADAKIKRVTDSYQTKLDIETNKMQLFDSMVKEGIAQANDIISRVHQVQSDNAAVIKDAIDIVQKKADAASKLDTSITEAGGRKILVNNQTGEKIADLGSATSGGVSPGGVRSGGLVYTAQDHASDSQKLDASRGTDSYVDPNLYLNLYNAWINGGGTLEGFLSTYPPKNYVNPANDWLPKFLLPSSSSLDAQINSLF